MSLIHSLEIAWIREKVDACYDMAEAYFACDFPRPISNLKQKGKAAGTAHLQKNELRFNAYMFHQNQEKFLNEVVPHEVAHLLVYHLYGGRVKPHGKEWQFIMREVFHRPAARTHNFDVPEAKQLFPYRCQCQVHQLTIRRHNKIKQGTQYLCRQCKGTLFQA